VLILFFKRFTDPWLSRERKCFKISKNSILKVIGFNPDSRYSYEEINKAMLGIDKDSVEDLMQDIADLNKHSEFTEVLLDQLTPRFDDAREILDFILSQECSDYVEPRHAPATSRITLRGHQALDQEKYTADLIKVLAGEKSRFLINEFYNDHRKYDSLPSAQECPNLDLKDAILVAENTIFAFNKYIKRNTKMITSGKPDNLSSLVTMTLRSRFFEGIGIRLTGSLKLIGDRSHAFSYTSWYKRLNEKSAEYVTQKVQNSCKQLYSDVVKYGILSDNYVLTQKDHFEVLDIQSEEKHVKVKSLSRAPLISFIRSWVSANASYSFDFDTVQAFFRGKLLSRAEYRVSDDTFVRNASGLYDNILVNGLPTQHLITTYSGEDISHFTHTIFIESSSQELEVDYELTELGQSKHWAPVLKTFLKNRKTIYSNVDYYIRESGDHLIFKTLDTATVFSLDVFNSTMTIGFETKGTKIPICHATPKSITELKLGYDLTYDNIVKPVRYFSSILDQYDDLQSAPESIKNVFNFIIYNTTLQTRVSKVNYIVSQFVKDIHFDNIQQVDIFKSLLLDNNYAIKTVNTNRLYQYVNNLFKHPLPGDNYLTSVTIEDKMSLKLAEALESDSEDETESIVDDVEFETRSLTDVEEEEIVDNESDFDLDLGDDALAAINDDIDLDDIDFDAFGEDEILNENETFF